MKLEFHLLSFVPNHPSIAHFKHRVNLQIEKVYTEMSFKYSIVLSNGRTNEFALFRIRGGAL